MPKSWRKYVEVNEEDDDITKADKYKHNSMVVKKKPYFFIYLYSSLMKDYQDYEKNFNNLSLIHFGVPMKALLLKKEKSEREMMLIRKYKKYSPVLETDCVMNMLCREIEDIDFDIKYKSNAKSILPQFADTTYIDTNKLLELNKLYKEYKAQRKYKAVETMVDNEGVQDDEMNELLHTIMYTEKDECRKRMYELFSEFNNHKVLFNHLVALCNLYNYSYDCVWDILGDDILDMIPKSNNKIIVEDKNGFEYLGRYYSIKEIE